MVYGEVNNRLSSKKMCKGCMMTVCQENFKKHLIGAQKAKKESVFVIGMLTYFLSNMVRIRTASVMSSLMKALLYVYHKTVVASYVPIWRKS